MASSASDRAYYLAHREEHAVRSRAYYLSHREEIAAKRIANREENAAYAKAWRATRRDQTSAYNKAYREAHRDQLAVYDRVYHEANLEERAYHRAYNKKWRKANPELVYAYQAKRRALKMCAPRVEKIDRAYVYERDGGKCHLCGKKAPRSRFHLDHLVPLSRGGSHTHDNLSVAHPYCNASRGTGRLPAQLRLVG